MRAHDVASAVLAESVAKSEWSWAIIRSSISSTRRYESFAICCKQERALVLNSSLASVRSWLMRALDTHMCSAILAG